MKLQQTLISKDDQSVNFIFDNKMETRYVRRSDDYFIAYLSSHTGCNKACRFCHLTQTKQTDMQDASIDDLVLQAQTVIDYYHQAVKDGAPKATYVNFNFMARGEPLANPNIYTAGFEVAYRLALIDPSLTPRFNYSTIMPTSLLNVDLISLINPLFIPDTTIYYSLYSLDPNFRLRWLPKALDPNIALEKLADLQRVTGIKIAIHHTLIKDENDQVESSQAIVDLVKHYGIQAKFNLVRYNPYSDAQGKETDEFTMHRNFKILRQLDPIKSKIVSRVGFDIKASCGMFVND